MEFSYFFLLIFLFLTGECVQVPCRCEYIKGFLHFKKRKLMLTTGGGPGTDEISNSVPILGYQTNKYFLCRDGP